MAKKLTPAKAREILHDKSVHGHPLTDKQRKFFGAMSKENVMQNGGRKTNKKIIDNKIETLQKFMKDTSFLKELQSRPIPSEFNPNKNTTFNSNNIPPTDRVLQRELEEVDKNKTPGGISTWNVSVNPSTTKYWTPPKQKNGGWLDKFDSGGTMQEYQENYNDYSVSAPEGFQGDGYSNVGRNYSPAWGGQFAMGGSLPGAVGFTYARTAGSAPSEGPYAKKTLPSAQNGQEMRYYQEGLDWNPKMISRDGTELAQQGKLLPKIGSREYYQAADVRPMGDNTRTVSPSRTAELDAQVKKAQEEYAKKNIRRDELRALTPKESNEREIAKRNEEWRKKNLTMIPGVESEYEKTNRWKEENKKEDEEVANVQSAKAALQNKGAYTFPTGATKNWNEMDAREKAYVVGKTQSRSFEVFPEATSNQPVKTTINSLNPLPVINKWVENFATAPYVARETDSYMPYVAAVADPAITLGALAIANPELASGELFTKQLLNPKKPFQNIIKGVAAFEEGELSSYLANKLQKDAIKSTGKSVISTTKTNAKDLANVPEASLKAKFLNGGEHNVIKDNLGQWAHPGEITEIGSNEITMEGVPYDVLGVSDKGDVKLMKPGKNYKFKGKKVTEYPVAKNGVNQQDQKTLEQLDQLTNFTNYNKPQPGGWLNKYN